MKVWSHPLTRHALCACALATAAWAPDAHAQGEEISLGMGTTSSVTLVITGGSYYVMASEDFEEMDRLREEEAIFRQLSFVDAYIDANGADLQDAFAVCDLRVLGEVGEALGLTPTRRSCARVRALRPELAAALSAPRGRDPLARARAVRAVFQRAFAPTVITEARR